MIGNLEINRQNPDATVEIGAKRFDAMDAAPSLDELHQKLEDIFPVVEILPEDGLEHTPKIEESLKMIRGVLPVFKEALLLLDEELPIPDNAKAALDAMLSAHIKQHDGTEDAFPLLLMQEALPLLSEALPVLVDETPAAEVPLQTVESALPILMDSIPVLSDALYSPEEVIQGVKTLMPILVAAAPFVMPEAVLPLVLVDKALPLVENVLEKHAPLENRPFLVDGDRTITLDDGTVVSLPPTRKNSALGDFKEKVSPTDGMSIKEKQDVADQTAQEYNKKFHPVDRAQQKGIDGITETENGGISFENSSAIYIDDAGNKAKVSVEATGNRSSDFDKANKLLGLDETPDGYVWHHLDDYDVESNTITMELIQDEAHNASKPHSGGCAQYDAVHGPTYNPPRKDANNV